MGKDVSLSDFGFGSAGTAVAEPPKRKARKGKGKGKTTAAKGKRGRKPLDPLEKFTRSMLRKAKRDEMPALKDILPTHGKKMKIRDIAIFIGKPRAELLQGIAAEIQDLNTLNLSARVSLRQVKKVGAEILTAGRMYMPIQVAQVEETGTSQCWSGRHRLVFLALLYGVDIEVPVLIDKFTQDEGRDAVAYANTHRRIETLEKAEHTVLKHTGGRVDISREDMYAQVVTRKTQVPHFCAYLMMDKKTGRGAKFDFEVAPKSSRKDCGLTTIRNIMGFWKKALPWHKEMTFAEFNEWFTVSVEFLNALVAEMRGLSGFMSDQHLAAMPLVAIGTYFNNLETVERNSSMKMAPSIAKTIVGMGEIGRQKSDVTHDNLSSALAK
jgi:hypothetical protein